MDPMVITCQFTEYERLVLLALTDNYGWAIPGQIWLRIKKELTLDKDERV